MKENVPPSPAHPSAPTSSPDSRAPASIGDDELHAWVDGRLDAAAHARLQARLAQDAERTDEARAWSAQRDALRALHADIGDEPVPPGLLAAARAADAVRARARRGQRLVGLAASVLVAFAAGWLGHGAWRQEAPATVLARQFASDAALAHVVYVPEVRHPVEVAAAQQDHLVQWLSRRLGRPLRVPQLQAQGFELVGGRLLPGEGGARAQFMFQNASGTRLTLYIGALDARAPGAGDTAFRFAADEGVPRFYWVDQGMGYALSGALSRAALLEISDAVYRQLGAPPGSAPAALPAPRAKPAG